MLKRSSEDGNDKKAKGLILMTHIMFNKIISFS